MRLFHFIILLIYLSASQSSFYANLKNSQTYLKHSVQDHKNVPKRGNPVKSRHQIKLSTARDDVPKLIKIFKNGEGKFDRHRNGAGNMLPKVAKLGLTTERYRMDPVLNYVRRKGDFRRRDISSDSSSSSLELENWKDEWRQHWITKKLEAINASTEPKGDVVNMVAARPWGVPCGDPDRHDVPWGSCMLAMECEPEYRIFRGDYFCGRTSFVCCALQLTNYDLYQGFDVSFADSALTTSSEEKRGRNKGSKEKRRRKRIREKRKRRRERVKRKKKIKKNIKKIIREMRKILNRSYRNGTTQRKRRTKRLKKFIKDLKKKYKTDRKVVSVLHEKDLIKIDHNLMKKLDEIRAVNSNFVKNETFRKIVLDGMVNKKGARMLVEAYPELVSYFRGSRRNGDGLASDYLDYDIEYGMLYY